MLIWLINTWRLLKLYLCFTMCFVRQLVRRACALARAQRLSARAINNNTSSLSYSVPVVAQFRDSSYWLFIARSYRCSVLYQQYKNTLLFLAVQHAHTLFGTTNQVIKQILHNSAFVIWHSYHHYDFSAALSNTTACLSALVNLYISVTGSVRSKKLPQIFSASWSWTLVEWVSMSCLGLQS